MKNLRFNQALAIKILFVLMLIVFVSGANGWIVNAQDGGGEGEPQLTGKTQILSRFDQQERVRVIVQVDVPNLKYSEDLMTPMILNAQDALTQSLTAYDVRVVHQYRYIPFMALEVDRAGFEGLLKSPWVVGVEEDILMKPLLDVSVPLINADDVWAAGYSGGGQVVAVLDTGVDKNHPALAGKVVSEACYSTTDANYGASSLCPGGDPVSIAEGSALPYATICPSGDCDHGTHVAGIVAGNNSTVKGVAKDSNLIAIQVFSKVDNSNYCGSEPIPCVLSFTSDQIKGLERVYNLRSSYSISAVNLSLGGGLYTNNCDTAGVNISYKQAVDLLRSVGIATIAASGNNLSTTGIASPACISTVVSVGATTDFDTVASYSNSASILDLLAPGSFIYSTIPNSQYVVKSGTSMATPHVAGAWALIKSAKPDATVAEVLQTFKDTGVPIIDYRNSLVKPRIDVFAALQQIVTPQASTPTNIDASDGDYYDKVLVTWASAEHATFYQVYRDIGPFTTSAELVADNIETNLFDDTTLNGLEPGTTYYYWVKGCNPSGCSDFSASDDGWIRTEDLAAPTDVQASNGLFTDKVRISWNGVGDASYYKVFRNTINSTVGATVLINNAVVSPYDDLTALHETEYYYWVQACKNNGCSPYSEVDMGYLLDDYFVFLPLLNKNFAASVDPIKNGGFENGNNGYWIEYSSNEFDLILPTELLLVPPHQGNYAVWLGGENDEISQLSQTVAISSSAPYLHFWYWIGSEDYCGYDYFRLKVNSNVLTQSDLCSSTSTSGWVERVVNLSAYASSTVTLMFEVTLDDVFNSNFFLDDVSMSYISTTSVAGANDGIEFGDLARSRIE